MFRHTIKRKPLFRFPKHRHKIMPVLAMAAIYGQVVVNDAMVARYMPVRLRAKAFSVRYFLGFTASGLTVPLITLMYGQSGFSAVLGRAAAFGSVMFTCAAGFFVIAPERPGRE
jgi:hypothetical protein